MKLSFHVGKAGAQMSQAHNRRELGAELDNRLDPMQFNLNVILIDQNLKDVIEKEFGDSIDLYNANAKPSRKKDREKYLKECEKATREIIIQVGDADECLTDEQAKDVYSGIVDNFKTDNPNLRICGAYIHLDETTPHLHLDVIPVAHSTRGVTKRASLEGALREMGYTSDRSKFNNRAFIKWTENQRCQIEQDLRVSGYNITDHEPRSKEHMTKHREHWELRAEKALQEAQELNDLVDTLKEAADRERVRAHGYREKYEDVEKLINNIQKSLDEVIDYPYATMKDVEEMKDRLKESREKLGKIKDEIEAKTSASGLAPKTYTVEVDQGERTF